MTKIRKTQSRIYITFDDVVISQTTGYAKFEITYYDLFSETNSVLESFEFSTDGGSNWYDCIQPLDEYNINTIKPTGDNGRKLYIYWDAATQLGCWNSYDLRVRIRFNDEADDTGEDSQYFYYPSETTTFEIDFRITEVPDDNITKPKAYDPYLDADFDNPEYIRDTTINFVYEIATDSDFGNIVFSKDTSVSTTDWTADSLTFPDDGINGKNQFNIIYDGDAPSDPDISDDTDYYFRIRIEPTQSYINSLIAESGVSSKTFKHGKAHYPLVWFKNASNALETGLNYQVDYLTNSSLQVNFGEILSNDITIYLWNVLASSQSVSSSTANIDISGLSYDYPFVWFKDNNGILFTPNQFSVVYTDTDNIDINFYETFNGTIYYDLGNNSSPPTSVDVTDGDLTDNQYTITHNKGKFPFVWFKDGDGNILTANNYKVTYDNMNSFTVDFGESISGTITIFYRA